MRSFPFTRLAALSPITVECGLPDQYAGQVFVVDFDGGSHAYKIDRGCDLLRVVRGPFGPVFAGLPSCSGVLKLVGSVDEGAAEWHEYRVEVREGRVRSIAPVRPPRRSDD